MIKSTDYSKIIIEDLIQHADKDAYGDLITKNIIPMVDEEGAIVEFEPISHTRHPSLTTFTDKFADMKNRLDAIFEENNRDSKDARLVAIVQHYFNQLQCNRIRRPSEKKNWKDLFNRIQEAPTIDDCRKFDVIASGTEDGELITAAMDIDTKARKLFGNDYLSKNNQDKQEFIVEWDG